MKVYGWIGARAEAGPRLQTREIVAAKSRAAVGRIVGRDPRSIFNLVETGNHQEIELASAEPGVVFWKPLDYLSDEWTRDPTPV